MVTKEQLATARHFHYTGTSSCSRVVGPRGGVKVSIVEVRASGQLKTWKTRPAEFRLPVKYGLYESFAIDHGNAMDFHVPGDCQLVAGMLPDENEAPITARP
jgi:hypothetical protein